jgi:cell pole-organizing protein PopZ
VGTKGRFRRAVSKSFSYRYEIGATAGPDGAPSVRAIIESNYRGRAASWTIKRSPISDEQWTLRGNFLAPDPEDPLTYPETPAALGTTVDPPAPEVTQAAQAALLARAAAKLAARADLPPTPQPPIAPAPAPTTRRGPTSSTISEDRG